LHFTYPLLYLPPQVLSISDYKDVSEVLEEKCQFCCLLTYNGDQTMVSKEEGKKRAKGVI